MSNASDSVFRVVSHRYAVDGQLLREQRRAMGYTQIAFAAACGWSSAYQCMLENNHIHEVSERVKTVIEQVLKRPHK
jgi:transcriptional regulator with XRE-family HTH domain